MQAQLAHAYLALRDFVAPLVERVSTLEGLEYLFHRYGWIAPLDAASAGPVRDATGILVPVQQFLAVAGPIRDRLDADPEAGPTGPEVAALIETGAVMVRAVASIGTGAAALPPPFDRAELWESVGRHVLDDLVDDYVRARYPVLYAVLRLWGAIRHEPTVPAEPLRRPYVRILVDWAQLGAIVTDPAGALAAAYHWDEPGQPFAYDRALAALAAVGRALGVSAYGFVPTVAGDTAFDGDPEVQVARNAEALRIVLRAAAARTDRAVVKAGLDLLPAARTGEPAPTGFVLRPVLIGTAGVELPLGPFVLRWQTTASAGDAIGVALLPDEARVVGGAPTFGTSLELAQARAEPLRLFGTPATSRLEVSGLSARLTVGGSIADPELVFRVAASEVALRFDPAGSGDYAAALGGDERTFTAAAAFEWSSRHGMSFTGGAGLVLGLGSPRRLGGVTLEAARLRLALDGGGLRLTATAAGSVALGPVIATVTDIGVAAALRPPPGVTDPAVRDLELAWGFEPPSGIGLAMDTPAATLGGFLRYERATGRYSGAVELRVIDRIAVTAVALIDTKRPDGASGLSFLAVVDTTFPRPIPLGGDLYLTGVGGLLGLHRGIDLERLQRGLRDGVVDHVLFPTDVVANMASIVTDLGEVFPYRRDQFVVAPTAKLAWHVPPLITANVGLVVEAPAPIRVALVGTIHARVPHPDAPLLVLNADFVGAFDVAAGMLSFDASIYDSHLGGFAFAGDLALRASWGARKDVVATLGGFHPDYHPAAELRLPALRRVTISLLDDNPRLTLSAYLAITSNTIQVGAELDFHFGVRGFELVGVLGFDALFQLSPFGFVAAARAHLAVRAGGATLLSVALDLELRGTAPWYAKGTASFSICWFITIKVRFEKTWGEDRAIEAPRIAVLPLVLAELARAESWTARPARGASRQVRLRDADPPGSGSGPAPFDPSERLGVAQRALPLGTALERFGAQPPADVQRVDIVGLRIATTTPALDPITAEFAPASFRDLSDADKLRAAPFETRRAGVVTRDAGVAVDALLARPVRYEQIISDASGQAPPARGRVDAGAARFERAVPGGAIGRSAGARRAARDRQVASVRAIEVLVPRFAVVTVADLRPARPGSDGLTREQAEQHLAELTRTGERGAFAIIPEHEMAS